MQRFPDTIDTLEELEEVLTRPDEVLVAAMKRLEGDLLILGAGGKIGPTLAKMAKRAVDAAEVSKCIFAVATKPLPQLEQEGIETIACNLLDPDAVACLPHVENVLFLVGRKFGSTGSEPLTWAVNVVAPYHVARSFSNSRIVVFSTGCVYPVMEGATGGATEQTRPAPVGEYAMSCLGRERMFDYLNHTTGLRVVHFRLNYAVELRYGVLVDVAVRVFAGQPIDVTTGFANVIWQGDVCSRALRSLELAASPAKVLNVTGKETLMIRQVAQRFGDLFGRSPIFVGQENGRGYLSNATEACRLFGEPSVSTERMIAWIAHWVSSGGENLHKPTHFETQNGEY